MDVDSRLPMRPLSHHSWDERDIKVVQFVSDPMDRDGLKAGIAKDDFILALASGVAVKGGLNVGGETCP